ncbi:cytochrome P450 [Streptomyces sp. Ru62]|uniref:cytochrome P450 n=1 Tax=Streptomyces sp. Ru62 TaxID=2080745 RepID=UPI000CDD7B62|nr:cytochrome P450 [Streptomyces sp. Ru62]POX58822.1 cytochrome P450 [Streptomyces sp. Ru62]
MLHGSRPGGLSNAQEGQRLRSMGPAPAAQLPGTRARVVVDHGLAQRLTAGSNVSRDARAHWPDLATAEGLIAAWTGTHNALNSEGADHTRFRAPIAAALSRRRVEAMTPVIEAIVTEALTDLDAETGVIDLVQAYALRIPAQVIVRLLGVPEAVLTAFQGAAAVLFDTAASPAEVDHARRTLLDLLGQMVDSKRRRPGDDLVSDLVRAADASSDALSDQELCDQLMLIVIAGTETTVHAIGTLLVHLMTHPLQRALITDGTVELEDALEESLRLQPPVSSVPLRFAVRDFTDSVTGEAFTRGEAILIHTAATGLDPQVHDDPEVFDVRRPTSRRHLAFGNGPHFCPGAPLARREVVTAVAQWLATFPDSRLAVDPDQLHLVPSFISNGYQTIPVHLR